MNIILWHTFNWYNSNNRRVGYYTLPPLKDISFSKFRDSSIFSILLKHHDWNLPLLHVGLVISDPYLIRLALNIHINNLSLTGILRICLSTWVLLEPRFALQYLLVFKYLVVHTHSPYIIFLIVPWGSCLLLTLVIQRFCNSLTSSHSLRKPSDLDHLYLNTLSRNPYIL